MSDILIKTLQGFVDTESKKTDAWRHPSQIAEGLRENFPITIGTLAMRANLSLAVAGALSLQEPYDLDGVTSLVHLIVHLSGYTDNQVQATLLTQELMRELVIFRTQLLRSVRDCPSSAFRPEYEAHAQEGCLVCKLRVASLEESKQEMLEQVVPFPGLDALNRRR